MLQDKINQIQFKIRNDILGKLELRSGIPNIQETIYDSGEFRFYTLLLRRVFGQDRAPSFSDIIDIGCRDWSYVHALAEYFPSANLTGIEVDGYRRYWNLYRRIDLAKAHSDSLRKKGRTAEVRVEDFMNFDLISDSEKAIFCFFYPYVSENPCLQAGLPAKFVNFSSLVQHAKELGLTQCKEFVIFSAHQGNWEAEEARRMYGEVGLKTREFKVEVTEFDGFWPSPYETIVFFAQAV